MASSITRQRQTRQRREIPPLYPGDHLTQKEFHRRYEAYPDDTRFELIGGIVYMMAPAGFDHGRSGFDVCAILGWYQAETLGVIGFSGASVILSNLSEPQPDAALILEPECGGQTTLKQIKAKRYVHGAPELVLEVSHSTVAIDLHAKLRDYRQSGVLEYIVVCLDEQVIRWFDLSADKELSIDKQGILKSHAFPGLWIDSGALFQQNSGRLIKTLERGIATKEHREFVAKLVAKKQLASGQSKRNGETRT